MSSRVHTHRSVPVATYAIATYLLFLTVLVYAVGFFADVGVPTSIDGGNPGTTAAAVTLDLALLAAFALQHTVMARRSFKRVWSRLVPPSAERTTYVLASTLLLALTFCLWRPFGGVVWRADGAVAVGVRVVYVSGWVLAISSTFLVSHADLFGLRQAWRQRAQRAPQFTERGLHRLVRHPLMLGFLIVFWSAPTMSVGHLVFAAASTGYIVVGVAFEERDLVREFGVVYLDYRDRVPALVPRLPPPRSSAGCPARRTTAPTAFDRRHPL